MLSRRSILLGAAAGTSLVGLGAMRAAALSTEPMAPEDLQALSLACSNLASHTQLVADARLLLDDAIRRGAKSPSTTEVVVCPFCHCAFQVSSGVSF